MNDENYSLKKNWPSYLLLFVGSLFTIGHLVQSENIKGLAFMTAASPLPLVFSSFRGVEGFASKFYVEYEYQGKIERFQITPKVYESLRGPYNRRNAYGAVIAGAPMLTGPGERELIQAAHKYGFCYGPLGKEFNIKGEPKQFKLIVESQTEGREKTWEYEVSCD